MVYRDRIRQYSEKALIQVIICPFKKVLDLLVCILPNQEESSPSKTYFLMGCKGLNNSLSIIISQLFFRVSVL